MVAPRRVPPRGYRRPVLAYDDVGAGPPLVLVHGLGSDRSRWAPIVERLADSFRCVSVDLPGHGDSGDEGRDALSAAVAVQETWTGLGVVQPVVVGHSLGSTVALLVAALFSPRSVVAVDPVHLYTPHFADGLAPFRDRLLGDDFDAAFAEWEQTLDLGPVDDEGRAALLAGLRPRAGTVRAYWSVVLDPDAAASGQPQLTAALAGITVPTLVLWASPTTPEDEAILDQMATTEVEVLPGAGHFLHLVDPDAFVARLRRWVGDLPG